MIICDYKSIDKLFYEKIQFESIESVTNIVNDVKSTGDIAVRKYAKMFGDGDITEFKVSDEEIEAAMKLVDKDTISAINYAVKNISDFAKAQLSSIKELEINIGGNTLGHKIIPLDSVGCYIPGGNYPLPSTALMTITPAKVAGVKRIVAMSPKIKPVTIAAAHIAGADEIYKIGGVQGVAAMAYGTETINKVNKIVGPGNKFVTAAKKTVYGECGIDFLAGPSEVLIVADESSNPKFVAADMLAQCEHDKDARAFLICSSKDFAVQVKKHAEEFLSKLQTKDIAEISFAKSMAIVTDNIEEAIELSNNKAPEHLELCLKNSKEIMDKFTNYGSLFIGNYSAEVFGDYVSGTNHTLPTNQVSKYSGGLSVFDYIKVQTYQIINKDALKTTADNASILANQEGLFAHKLAADIRNN